MKLFDDFHISINYKINSYLKVLQIFKVLFYIFFYLFKPVKLSSN